MRRLYTRRGDLGETDLLGERVVKDDPRIELIGELDETTSFLGLARSAMDEGRLTEIVIGVQRDLYRVMADLAFVTDTRPPGYETSAEWVERVEEITDQLTGEIELGRQLITWLPGAALHHFDNALVHRDILGRLVGHHNAADRWGWPALRDQLESGRSSHLRPVWRDAARVATRALTRPASRVSIQSYIPI